VDGAKPRKVWHSLSRSSDLDVDDSFVFNGRIGSCGSAHVSRRAKWAEELSGPSLVSWS